MTAATKTRSLAPDKPSNKRWGTGANDEAETRAGTCPDAVEIDAAQTMRPDARAGAVRECGTIGSRRGPGRGGVQRRHDLRRRGHRNQSGDYEQFPSGATIGLLYYQFGQGNESYARGIKTTSDAKLDTNVGLIRLLHVYEIAPNVTIDPQFLLPVGAISTGGVLAPLGNPGGVGDVILTAPIKFKLDTEFKDIFAITPYLIAPTGTYDETRPLNLGANRWQGVIQTAYVKHFNPSGRST